MSRTNVAEIKAKLSEYLDRVLAGERIVICRHNTPIAELRRLDEPRLEPRPVGPLPGRPAFEVPPSFFEPLPDDELDLWEGIGPQPAAVDESAVREGPRREKGKRQVSGTTRRRPRRRRP